MNIEWNKVTWYSKLVAVVLGLLIWCLGIYVGTKIPFKNPPQEVSTTTVAAKSDITLKQAFEDANLLYREKDSSIFVFESDSYSERTTPFENAGTLETLPARLFVINSATGEKKTFNVYPDLVPQEMVNFYKDIPRDISYTIRVDDVRVEDSFDSFDRYVTGRLTLFYSGDDDAHIIQFGYFNIDLDTSKIKSVAGPLAKGYKVNIKKVDSGVILYESIDVGKENEKVVGSGLTLEAFNPSTGKIQTLANYSAEVFYAHCTGKLHLVADQYGNCDTLRSLNPFMNYSGTDYSSPFVSYYDFLTREIKTVKIEL